jgi:alanine racemase
MPTLNDSQQDMTGQRPTWLEIDLDALAANFRLIRTRVGPEVAVMAVVKANAYGHGSVRCARRLAVEGAEHFGVALPEEGIELRNSGITQSILCLAGFWDGQAHACVQHRLTPIVYRIDQIEAFDKAAMEAGVIAGLHVKVDTGMGRLGVRSDQLSEFIRQLPKFEHIRVEGLMTHFAAADDPSCQPLTDIQVRRFDNAVKLFRENGHQPNHLHLANSAAIFSHRQTWGNLIRPGGVLYGLWRDVLSPSTEEIKLRSVMALYSRITLLKWVPQGETLGYGCTFEASRQTLVATIPIGYHDGYMRGLSNRAHVIIRGVFAPVVGRVSMDLTLVDVTNVAGVALNDEVTLLGHDHAGGSRVVTAEDLAKIAGTLSYEVTCGISERVPRVYVGQ